MASPLLPESEFRDAPSWVLLDVSAYMAKNPQGRGTFATSTTSTGETIRVAFSVVRPPSVSHFCVHCPDLADADFNGAPPTVISAEADLVLLRVSLSRHAPSSGMRHHDYFLYRAHPRRPSLDLLPSPERNTFLDNEVALVRCGDDEYAVAALRNKCYKAPLNEDGTLKEPLMFRLCLYRSSRSADGWITRWLSVALAEPRRDTVFPVVETARYHHTTKVITLGGPRGTVGWVDLWRGILVCNVLEENPVLHDVPLPPPAMGNWPFYHQRCPFIFRDITVSLGKDCIKYVELEIGLPNKDVAVTDPPVSYLDWLKQGHELHRRRDGWTVRTWSMPIPIPLSKDWSPGCTVNADEIVVEPMYSELLPRPSGSISEPSSAATLLPLLNTAFPIMSMDDDVVYLLSTDFLPTAGDMDVVIAVDLRKKMLRGVGMLTAGKDFASMRSCTTEISKYLNLYKAAGKRKRRSKPVSKKKKRSKPMSKKKEEKPTYVKKEEEEQTYVKKEEEKQTYVKKEEEKQTS